MNIGIACDHRGYPLKEKLSIYLYKKGYNIIDFGTSSKEQVDYPDYAFLLSEAVVNKTVDLGIAICGSGIGISIACNKVKGIRCAKVDTPKEARLSRLDNDANIISLNGTMPVYKAKDIVDTFLKTPFSGLERHLRRIDKMTSYENKRPKRKKKEDKQDEC